MSDIQGEGEILTHGQNRELMNPFIKSFREGFLDKKSIKPDCLYNSDQTGLYYQKFDNILYVNKQRKNKLCGCKQLNDKAHKTLMVCIDTNGNKVP